MDDPDRATFTIGQAAELLGVQVAFLRSLDTAGVVEPARSAGGHRRWSRAQLVTASRIRLLLDDGHSLVSAEVIVALQDDVATLQARLDTQT
ncbi:helix-turn-helix domain-containing protein [Klenkia marina]|uniref:helix-turn-helix domain-containing protein n=1 Tax=Klenkia marina TaxID=1960309 RepID=UPI001FB3E05E|nr:helix-turn-helix domain-containing protein [Klenkia marina]